MAGVTPALGQAPPDRPKPVPDEFRAILKEVEEAYKAPLEVDKDVLDELRKQYRNPTPDRELKIFKEIARLYDTTPAQNEVILRELRRAYQEPSAEQEFRIFQEIRRGGQLPLGTVPVSIQAEQAAKLFGKLDADGDGVLGADEMPTTLREQRGQWDANRDATISFAEYAPYFQAQLKWIGDGVAAGEIPLRLPKAAAIADISPAPVEQPRATVNRAGNLPAGLPDWFGKYDLDADGQVGLYEWKKVGQRIAEFLAMDANSDGFLEAKELLAHLAMQPAARTTSTSSR
jgi:hypothetical protein